MSDATTIREMVEKIVSDALASGIPGLRRQIVQRVLDELPPALAASDGGPQLDRLKAAIAMVHGMTAQSDVLRALLDGLAQFCGRSALFLARGNSAVGWQGRGFRDNEAIKLLTLDLSQGLAARAVRQRVWAEGPITEFAEQFAIGFGAPSNGNCLVAPLVIRERVSGLIYADAGAQPGGHMDLAALEIMTQTAGTWLEVLALRKSTGAPPQAAPGPPLHPAIAGTAAIPDSSLPQASSAAAAAGVVEASKPIVPLPPVPPSASGENEDELHRKARRFAKLLVDEIKLYNQAKVAAGKLNHDLYDRLKDDIDKSRTSYDKRYSQTAVASAEFFIQELIRNLADGNPTLLGSNFPR
jgi:hypothetical protein